MGFHASIGENGNKPQAPSGGHGRASHRGAFYCVNAGAALGPAC